MTPTIAHTSFFCGMCRIVVQPGEPYAKNWQGRFHIACWNAANIETEQIPMQGALL
jgi:hypothetical protein